MSTSCLSLTEPKYRTRRGRGSVLIVAVVMLLSGAGRLKADAVSELTQAWERGLKAYQAGRYSAALPDFERAAELAPVVFTRADEKLNIVLLREYLANCQAQLFQLDQAEQTYRRCLEEATRLEGGNGAIALRTKSNLGRLFRWLHQFDRAEAFYRGVLQTDPDPKGRAITAMNLGYLCFEREKFDEADRHLQASLKFWERQSGDEVPLQVASCQHGLGMSAHRQAKYEDAERLLGAALETRSRKLPAGHRDIQNSRGMLAAVYSATGRDQRAEPLLRQTEQGMQDFWGTDHPEVAIEQHELALLLERQGKTADAVRKFSASRQGFHTYIARTLAGLSQTEQIRFLTAERHRLADALAFSRTRTNDAAAIEAGLEWLLNGKGLALETLSRQRLLERAAGQDRRLADVVKEVITVRRKMAALTAAADDARHRQQLEQFAAREAELVRRLGAANQAAGQEQEWVTLQTVKNAAPTKAALLEFVRLDRRRPAVSAYVAKNHDPEDDCYLAWTVYQGRVRLFDLGSAAEIDAAIAELRNIIDKAADDFVFDPEAATEKFRDQSKKIAQSVLWPLLKELQGAEQWIISADGQLWLIPWSALVLPSGEFAIEKVAIGHVVSGRELTAQRPNVAAGKYSYVMADPDYDLSPGQVTSTVRTAFPQDGTPPAQRGRSAEAAGGVAKDWRRLPGTRTEAERIEAPLQKFTGGKVYVYRDGRALESFFKRILRPKAAVLATHGFFRPLRDSTTAENPLLHCGLVLAGANQRQDDSPVNDDGILTGMEVLEADLRGTELIVLSACDTGRGTIVDGEGVGGLQQAFHMAGTRNVMATLWQIPDQATASLMEQFWNELSGSDRRPDEALRNAQLQMIRTLRGKYNAAHPWQWAAPLLTTTGR